MRRIATEVLVIGGGPQAAGWYAVAMRGSSHPGWSGATSSHGTTGRYHGLLHSGGATSRTRPARVGIEENRVLRRTAALP